MHRKKTNKKLPYKVVKIYALSGNYLGTYRIARTWELCKKEAVKEWENQYSGDWHHVFGRYGILKYMVEAIVPLTRNVHIYEKTNEYARVQAMGELLHKYHYGRIQHEFLKSIARWEKDRPRQLRFEEIPITKE